MKYHITGVRSVRPSRSGRHAYVDLLARRRAALGGAFSLKSFWDGNWPCNNGGPLVRGILVRLQARASFYVRRLGWVARLRLAVGLLLAMALFEITAK